MTVLIKLEEVVPQNIEFSYEGERYTLPGDLTTPDLFRLLTLFQDAAGAETAAQEEDGSGNSRETLEKVRDAALALDGFLLDLLKIHHPDLERLPVGRIGVQRLVGALLTNFGFALFSDDDPEGDPGKDPTTATPTSPRRSPRSSGSPASRKRSGSRSPK